MKTDLLFSETQRFKQWWVWTLLLGINALFLYGIIQQTVLGKPWGNNPMSDIGICITFGMTLLLTLYFICMKLETRIYDDGIYIKFFPIHFAFKKIAWEDISGISIRRYNSLTEFGGWGIRHGVRGKAYNTSGNIGLQLVLVSGKSLLIGTHKAEELKKVLLLLPIHNKS